MGGTISAVRTRHGRIPPGQRHQFARQQPRPPEPCSLAPSSNTYVPNRTEANRDGHVSPDHPSTRTTWDGFAPAEPVSQSAGPVASGFYSLYQASIVRSYRYDDGQESYPPRACSQECSPEHEPRRDIGAPASIARNRRRAFRPDLPVTRVQRQDLRGNRWRLGIQTTPGGPGQPGAGDRPQGAPTRAEMIQHTTAGRPKAS